MANHHRDNSYRIITRPYNRHDQSMIVIDRATGGELAEYRLTPGSEQTEIRQMRRAIDYHLTTSGTLRNYQW